jgi:queuine tRNA-ribosyltransferase
MTGFSFTCTKKDKKTRARTGVIHTPHGDIHTPAFVPVGTQGSVKSLTPLELDTLGVQLYFVNTYHMYLRPGIDVVARHGGLHRFMHWEKPLMTDSGGFQVFSLGRDRPFKGSTLQGGIKIDQNEKNEKSPLIKISDEGVRFRSHWDGSPHVLTPESSMAWQWKLGADIHMAFDDCTPFPVTHEKARKSMERTHRWALRSLKEHNVLGSQFMVHSKTEKNSTMNDEPTTMNHYQALYGVVQGSVYKDLRRESAHYICSLDFDGIAIGGVSVGESKMQMKDVLTWVGPILPADKPRHLLGVGEIDDIFTLVAHGMETFDCVAPTRLARMGHVYTKKARKNDYQIDIQKRVFARDMGPIERDCRCYTCRHFTRAYIHHLFRVRELLAYRLTTIHNVYFIEQLLTAIRGSIANDSFLELMRKWL